ncbi:ABC transporter permease [Lacticaseibacillus camelliae]|uniref:ABC transporter permease n=1 Tax=Lacticaseibacillus camelliae DSM 22697 = JCM 13995 TaxID=1423730 RepID=A0A0R2F9I6_9LACO|nr:ABC transporter permease [Lacticaseibacillus camelliae]KRN24915.1 ABC transporter permease [Lacticaseibacillus camelliae DSM 22697 = JCM 13995]
MRKLWQGRLRRHQKEQFKYLRLVFNDHFVLILLILFGALLYGYSQWVKALMPAWWLRPALALVLTLLLSFGQLASLSEPADATFLLPQTSAFAQYLFKARRYSLLLPGAVLVLSALASVPLLMVLHFDPLSSGVTLGLTLLIFKDLDLWLQLIDHYGVSRPAWVARLPLFGAGFAALTLGLFLHPAYAMVIALALNLGFRWVVLARFQPAALDWLSLNASETKRMDRLYRFYNLFTDVPGLNSGVHRRKWLDIFLPLVRKTPAHTWSYLYLRGFLRQTTYLGLWVRLVVVGAVVLALIQVWWLAALVAALLVYLVGFQLLPLAFAYSEMVMARLYPVPASQQRAAFQHLTAVLLIVFALVLTVGPLVLGHWLIALSAGAGGLVLAVLFAFWYLPQRLRKKPLMPA